MTFTVRSRGRSAPRPMTTDTPGRYGARPYTDREMWGAFAFLLLFGLPFAGAGTWMLFALPGKWASGAHVDAIMLGAGALAFAFVGYGLIAGSLWSRKKVRVEAAAAFAHPDEPWKWRPDWAQGHALDGSVNEAWGAVFFAVLWNLVGTPGGLLGFVRALEQHSPWAPIALLFPASGVGLAIWAACAVARWRRYGVTRLELASVPVPVGRTLAGRVRTGLAALPEGGFTLVLSALRTERTGTDNDVRTHVIWQEEARAQGEMSSDGEGVRVVVPVAIRIPAEAPSTDHSDAADELAWKLDVRAKTRGLDYHANFEVPVYRTEESTRVETAADAAHLRAVPMHGDPIPRSFAVPDLPADTPRPEPRSPVAVTRDGEGLVVDFPAARNPQPAAWLTGFALLWTGIEVFLVAVHAPVIFLVVFALFDLLIVYIALTLWFEVVRLRVNPAGIRVARGFGAPGIERLVPKADIADVRLSIGMSSGTHVWYDLGLALKGGRTLPLGGGLSDKGEAEWIADRIKDALAGER